MNSKQKEEGFGKRLKQVLFRGSISHRSAGRQVRLPIARAIGKVILHCLESVGCCQGMSWHEELVTKVHIGHWPNKIDAKAATPCSKLAKFLTIIYTSVPINASNIPIYMCSNLRCYVS